mgnify:FL=1
MHGHAGEAAEEVGVAAVQPNAHKRTELGDAIHEVERRDGAHCPTENSNRRRPDDGHGAITETLAMG